MEEPRRQTQVPAVSVSAAGATPFNQHDTGKPVARVPWIPFVPQPMANGSAPALQQEKEQRPKPLCASSCLEPSTMAPDHR